MAVTSDSPIRVSAVARDDRRPAALTLWSAVIVVFATANALSFFFQNDYAWQRLTGEQHGMLITAQRLQVGMPLTVEFAPGRGILERRFYWALAGDVGLAAMASTLFAMLFGRRRPTAASQAGTDEIDPGAASRRASPRWRYSMRQMLVITTVVAVLLGLFAPAPGRMVRGLKVAYLAGPCLIVWSHFALRGRGRIAVCAALAVTFALAALAGALGERLFGDFTFALFGAFVCWTPQFAGFALAVVLARAANKGRPSQETQ